MKRAVRRVGLTAGLMLVALLPATAAIPSDTVAPPDMPMAITQPFTLIPAGIVPQRRLPETGLMVLVGSGLMGLAAGVRRTTRT